MRWQICAIWAMEPEASLMPTTLGIVASRVSSSGVMLRPVREGTLYRMIGLSVALAMAS